MVMISETPDFASLVGSAGSQEVKDMGRKQLFRMACIADMLTNYNWKELEFCGKVFGGNNE